MIESSLAFQPLNARPAPAADGFDQWKNAGVTAAKRRGSAMRYDMNDRTAGPLPVFGRFMDQQTALIAQSNAHALADTPGKQDARPDIAYETLPDEDEFSFGDVIDMINPLQHLPVIGMLYRKFTGDTIKPISSIIGGTIFGGPVGAVSSTVNVIVKDRTGKDVAENALSLAGIEMSPPKPAARDLVYLAPKEDELLPGTTLALVDLANAPYGKENFAARTVSPQRWNT